MKKFIPAGIIITIIFIILLIGCGGKGSQMNYYLYVACDSAGTYDVSSFKIDDGSGMLTYIPQTPAPLPCEPYAMVADHQGKRVFIALNCNYMSAKDIDPNTGVLNERLTQIMSSQYQSIAIDPTDSYILSADNVNGDVSTINADTLAVSSSKSMATMRPYSLAINPLSNNCYITKNYMYSTPEPMTTPNPLMIMRYNPKNGQIYDQWDFFLKGASPGFEKPTYVVVHPGGNYIYLANENSTNNLISGFKVIPGPDRLTKVTQVSTAYEKPYLAMDPMGRYLYAASLDGNALTIYNISATDGTLAKKNELVFDTWANIGSVVATPNGKYVYVSDHWNNRILMFKVTNDATALTRIGTSFTGTLGLGSPGLMTVALRLQ
jgi:6-phosphogluconolactonase (cycloisomerase 2 family)